MNTRIMLVPIVVITIIFGILPLVTRAQTILPDGTQFICTQQGYRTPDGRTVIVSQQSSNVPTTQSSQLSIQYPYTGQISPPGTPQALSTTQALPPAQCAPIMCPSGRTYPTCSPTGSPINYFANPCQMEQQSQGAVVAPGQPYVAPSVTVPQAPAPGNSNLYYVPPGSASPTTGSLYYTPPGQPPASNRSLYYVPPGQTAVSTNSLYYASATNRLRQNRLLYFVPAGSWDPVFFGPAAGTASAPQAAATVVIP